MTRLRAGGRSHCPVSFALDVFGDRWTLLVIRDLLLRGKKTYGEFLASEEGMATNVLADRLEWLEAQGIVRRSRDRRERRRVIYELTPKGVDLLPIVIEMIAWSAKHDPKTAAPPAFVRRVAQDREEVMRDVLASLGRGIEADIRRREDTPSAERGR
jgi:DNA-binding HxlR family transcriptional regulator